MRIPQPRRLPSGRWNVQLRRDGQSVSITEDTPELCLARVSAVMSGLDAAPGSGGRTLSQAIDRWIVLRQTALSPSTVRGYRTIQRSRFPGLMDRPVGRISKEQFQRAVNLEAKTVSPKTLRNAVGLVSSVIREETGRDLSPALPPVPRQDHPFLEPEQIPVFLDAIRGTNIELPCLLGLWSLRLSEMLALTPASFDIDRRLIHVRGAVVPDEDNQLVRKAVNKTAASTRDVPMCDRIAELVQDLDGPVVPMAAQNLRRRINEICRQHDLPEISIHGLRHSFCSTAFAMGWPAKLTMEVGGWSTDAVMQKIYHHLASRDREHFSGAMLDAFNKYTKKDGKPEA